VASDKACQLGSDIKVDYFFADGSYFKMHPGAPAEPVLVV